MRVSCPSCGATYEVPDSIFAAGGRTLRCARCAQEWIPLAPETEPEEDEAVPAPHSPAGPPHTHPDPPTGVRVLPPLVPAAPLTQDRQPAERPLLPWRLPPSTVLAAAWTLSLGLLAGLGLVAYLYRNAVQLAWPPSQLVYAALGLS